MLRGVFVQLCAQGGLSPQRTFSQLTRDGWDLDRAGAGQLLRAIQALAPRATALPPSLGRLVQHLGVKTIAQTIELRNELIHARRDPTREELGAVLRALRAWVVSARG